MAVLSKLRELSLPYNCYEVGHTWHHNCSEAALEVGALCFLESLKIYTPLYLLSQALQRRFDLGTLLRTGQSVLISSCFLSFNAFSFIFIFCILRKAMGKFYYLHCSYMPAFLASFFAILLERKSRRGPLALYVTNVASETLFRMIVARGKIMALPHGEVLIFSTAMACFLYIVRKYGFSRDFISVGIKYLIGTEEVKCPKKAPTKVESDAEGKEDVLKKLSNCTQNGTVHETAKVRSLLQTLRFASTVLQRSIIQTPAIQSIKSNPKHPCCPHSLSCPLYIFEGFFRPFAMGWSASFLLQLLSSYNKIMVNYNYIFTVLKSKQGIRLGSFIGGFAGIYRLVSCLMRWVGGKDSEWYAVPAGLLAGVSMKFFPSPSLALYLAWKVIELVYLLGVDNGMLPYIRGSMVPLYAASTAVLFYAAVLEPHNLKPTYYRFLNRITKNRMSEINRHVLDIFGTHASKMHDNFWPKLDLKFTSRVFQESVLVWLIH